MDIYKIHRDVVICIKIEIHIEMNLCIEKYANSKFNGDIDTSRYIYIEICIFIQFIDLVLLVIFIFNNYLNILFSDG